MRSELTYAGYRLGSIILPRLPRWLGYRLADRLGDLAWLFNRRAGRAVRENLSHVLGRPPDWQQMRGAFRHGARNYYDTFMIPTLDRPALEKLVKVPTWQHLDQALSKGRGAIMVGIHLSSAAFAGQAPAARGYRVTLVVEPVEPPKLLRLMSRMRAGLGISILPLGPDLTSELLAVLRRNEVVALLMDRDITGTGVPVSFFGAETRLPGGPALLALRTGASILPSYAARIADDQFAGEVGPPVEIERGRDLRESVQLTTQQIARRFEGVIGRYPEQWTVFEPIWPCTARGSYEDWRS